MMRRFTFSVALALLLTLAAVPAAFAGDEWCDIDPAVIVTTPKGTTVVVFVTNGAQGLQNAVAAQAAQMRYTAVPAGDGKGTVVTLSVTVPNSLLGSGFATRTKASTGPWGTGNVHSTATGTSGSVMKMQFTLDVA